MEMSQDRTVGELAKPIEELYERDTLLERTI